MESMGWTNMQVVGNCVFEGGLHNYGIILSLWTYLSWVFLLVLLISLESFISILIYCTKGLGFEPQHLWLLLFSFWFPIKQSHHIFFQKWETYHEHIHLKQTCPKMYGTLSHLSTLAHPHAPNLHLVDNFIT